MDNMCQRIERGDIKLEREEAIKVSTIFPIIVRTELNPTQAMCDIAADRATKLHKG